MVQKISFPRLRNSVLSYDSNADIKLLEKAFNLAEKLHSTQLRASGESYFVHPYNVALILSETMHLDVTTLAAALLHDVIEDTEVTYADIKEMFGAKIADIVEGVTKLSKLLFKTKEEQQAENIRKMFLAMAEDIRVILIKLADRLHNMRTLDSLPEHKQQRIARETIEIYAPLAHRLGIYVFKWELEDLGLKYKDKAFYQELKKNLALKKEEREKEITEFKEIVTQEFTESGIEAEITGRAKHFYSIYLKMVRQGKSLDEIYDLMGIRIITETVRDCYAILGIIHKIFRPIPGRFKDYIAVPKSNMYQSLHTAVMFKGVPVEVQIRTLQMHEVAEVGIAAHWDYKEGNPGDDKMNKKVSWIRQLIEWHQEVTDAHEYMELLKYDLFQDEVFIFTPEGDIKNLKRGATPLDFAYSIHTDVGNRYSGAKVNGKIVPMDYNLRNGDVIEILTSKHAKPNVGWIDIASTPRAKGKIKQYLRKAERTQLIDKGKHILKDHLARMANEIDKEGEENFGLHKEIFEFSTVCKAKEFLNFVNNRHNGIDDFFIALEMNNVSLRTFVQAVFPDYHRYILGKKKLEGLQRKKAPAKSQNGIIVEGIDNCMINFAKCCTPVPGDKIIGYITRGKGISIHKLSCVNTKSLLKDTQRIIDVHWDTDGIQGSDAAFPVKIHMEVFDRANLLFDLTGLISDLKLNIDSFTANAATRGKTGHIEFIINVKSLEQIENVIKKLYSINGVYKVYRTEN